MGGYSDQFTGMVQGQPALKSYFAANVFNPAIQKLELTSVQWATVTEFEALLRFPNRLGVARKVGIRHFRFSSSWRPTGLIPLPGLTHTRGWAHSHTRPPAATRPSNTRRGAPREQALPLMGR